MTHMDVSRLTRAGWRPEIGLREGVDATYRRYLRETEGPAMRRAGPRTKKQSGCPPKPWIAVALAVLLVLAATRPSPAADFLYAWPPSTAVGLTGYGVYQSTDGGAYQLIAQIPLSALPNPQQPVYLATGLQNGASYYFASSALATTGDGPLSYQTCVTINTDVVACDGDDGDDGSYVYINCFISGAAPRP